jgi:hypothetical protein
VSEPGDWPFALAGVRQYFVEPREIAQFNAPDPWRGGAETRWLLALYLISESLSGMTAAAYNARHYRQDDLPGPGRRDFAFAETVALLRDSERDRPFFLPHALSRVWQQGGCPTDVIPRVVHTLKPRLIMSDYYFADAMRNSLRFRLGVAAMGAMAILLLGLNVYFEPEGFEGTHNLFLRIALIPVVGGLGLVLLRLWLVRRRLQLEAVGPSLVLSTVHPLPIRRLG